MAAPDYGELQSGIQKQYDVQRQRAAQQEAGNLQGARDALNRRIAAMGGGPGGAAIAADKQLVNDSAQRLQQANEGIDQQQAAEERNLRQIQLGQQFESDEAEKGRQFEGGLALGTFGGKDTLAKTLGLGQLDIAAAGLTGQYHGQDTLAKQGLDWTKLFNTSELTGEFNGRPTLAAKTAADQHDLAVAGLTGNYNGAPTISKQALDATNKQTAFENDQNVRTNVFNGIQSLMAAGYKPEEIGALIKSIYPDFDMASIPGITSPRPAAPVAPPPTYNGPAARAPAPNYGPSGSGGSWANDPNNPNSPYYNPG